MDKEYAKTLIKNLFEKPFSKDNFTVFIKNLLNHISEDTFIYRGNYIPEAYRGYIRTIERIGKYQDLNDKKIDVLVVTLEKETTLERARTLQRNIIAWYLNGSRGGQLKDAALIAFVAPNNQDWRFSFVKMEYKFVKTDKGTIKSKEELTPAKRYSFLVGPNEASHTAQSQMVPTLINDKVDPTLEEIEKIFNIETVSKEFFEKYRSLYEMLVKELNSNQTFKNEASKNNINTSNFSKKLLGQIVFLYFLQKKGWLGVPKGKSWSEGDRFFLTNLYKDCVKKDKNYFNDYLEVLFYDTLNNPRSDKVDRNYSDYFQSKIPFLNGGLFEPVYNWKESFILLHNKIFKQILDVFDLYNFTVKEDEPLEKDVAVDPEMLGKVFENLLEENLRKGKGTYYTPREIVHYMCQESLINYLQSSTNIDEQVARKLVLVDKTINPAMDLKKQIKEKSLVLSDKQVAKFDRALNDITVCDPACGSGAFLVGMLQLIVSTKNKINGYKNLFNLTIKDKTEYELKKTTIQNSIYGVDIDSGAIEIAKLRLWLSLVVDYDLEDIEPLPNLDYKIMVGNSLIEKFDSKLLDKGVDDKKNDFIDQLNQLKKQYFITSDFKVKNNLRKQINELLRILFNYDNELERKKLFGQLLDKKNQLRIFALDNEQQTLADADFYKKIDVFKDLTETDHFEWHINFNEVFEKGGFDVVIANPPYVEFKNLPKSVKNTLINYETTKGKYDLYIPFIEKSYFLMSSLGIATYICPTRFMLRDYGQSLRSFFSRFFDVFEIVNFSDFQVFDTALNYTGVLIFSKNKTNRDFTYKEIHKVNASENLVVLLNSKESGSNLKLLTVSNNRLAGNKWIFSSDLEQRFLDRLKVETVPLKQLCIGIYQGIATGKDTVFIVREDVVTKFSLDRHLVFPILKGKDIHPYNITWSNNYVIYPYDKEGKVITENSLKDVYPNTYKYLKINKDSLKGRGYFDNSNKKWYELWNQRNLKRFLVPKIVTLDNASRNSFAFDVEGKYLGTTTTYNIILKDNELDNYYYLLGVLNSSTLNRYHKLNTIPQAGGFYRYQALFIEDLPIKNALQTQQKPIIDNVKKILSITKSSNYSTNQKEKTQVKEYEKQIDQIVYKLYELTPEEIQLVEQNGSN